MMPCRRQRNSCQIILEGAGKKLRLFHLNLKIPMGDVVATAISSLLPRQGLEGHASPANPAAHVSDKLTSSLRPRPPTKPELYLMHFGLTEEQRHDRLYRCGPLSKKRNSTPLRPRLERTGEVPP